MTSLIHLDIGGGVARLFIDRPARRNAFNQSMWEALPALVDTAMADRAVRLLIVQAAAPGPFSAGADISEFAECSRDPAWRRANQIAMRTTQVTLVNAPKPTIALVEGDCIGGGCESRWHATCALRPRRHASGSRRLSSGWSIRCMIPSCSLTSSAPRTQNACCSPLG